MLIITRAPGESIVIDGHIAVTVVSANYKQIRIGVDAPPEIPVHRREIHDRITAQAGGAPQGRTALVSVPPEFDALCRARGLAAADVLQTFMADLAGSAESNGEKERALAAAWLDGVGWPHGAAGREPRQ